MKSRIKNSKKNTIFFGLFTIFLILLDQATKYLAKAVFMKEPFVLIPGVFEFRYLENQSAAFSMDPITLFQRIFKLSYFTEHPESFLAWKMGFFYIFTIIITGLIIYLFLCIPTGKRYRALNVIAALFVAGAIGNLIDRMVNHYVIDFLYFSLIQFPVFNVADIYVTVAAVFFVIMGVFYYKEEDFARIFAKEV